MKIKFLVVLLTVICSFNYAQMNENNKEISFTASLGAFKSTLESTSKTYSYTSEGNTSYYLIANSRFGYYLNKNIEVEPELQLFILQSIKPGYFVNMNMLYNFDSDSSSVKSFVLVGYGLGNRVPMFNNLTYPIERSLLVHQINFGCGLKIFLTTNIAIRTEYRFQFQKYTDKLNSYSTYSTEHKYSKYLHNVFFGLSYFF